MLFLAKRCLVQQQRVLLNNRRLFSSSSQGVRPSSHEIRKQFLNYFIDENNHNFVRSSPVVPFCDPTVAFVNAGMNQFKNVFLGAAEPRFARVANTQKCVRVGGKHNDLSVVGTDGYHHTFFEMMGNWSFGDYFKKDACEMAWNLLTGPYGLDKNRLFVTYFGGDRILKLDPDYECRDIWIRLGVPEKRVIPFGTKDNFWEMGATGPCGPCTEIHYDHSPVISTSIDDVHARAQLVNTGLPDLTEIWNLVFIQYNRGARNILTPLPKQHVDTGMGMERLTAVLQNASSNYTTDLFQPIFDHISKVAKTPSYQDSYKFNDKHDLYTAYRIMADHSRMITACLSDGMFPDQNHKLRRVIRKVFTVSKNQFNHPDLLPTLVPRIVDILGPTYPEMIRNQSNVLTILENEQEIYRALLSDATSDLNEILVQYPQLEETDIIDSAGFVPAFKEFHTFAANNKTDTVTGDFMFKMYDTYGLREEQIEQLAEIHSVKLDRAGFDKCLKDARNRTRSMFANDETNATNPDLISNGHAYTENELKYNYRFNYATREYTTPKIRVKVLAVGPTAVENQFDVVLDQSTFYPESGGQESDQGTMLVEGNKLISDIKVTGVRMGRAAGVLVHSVQMVKGEPFLKVGDTVELRLDNKRRTSNIFNHTATHILNASVRKITNSVTYQRSSTVSATSLKLELAVLGRKVDTQTVREIQESVQCVIDAGNTVRTDVIDSQAFYTLDGITRIPGEIYPDRNVRIVSIVDHKNGIESREPCCGTHAVNTRELEYFCITNVRHTGRGAYQFSAVTGRQAKGALEIGDQLLQLISKLGTCKNMTASEEILKKIVQYTSPQMNVPHHIRLDCQEILSSAARLKREISKASLKEYVESEIQDLLLRSPISENPFLVHIINDIPASMNAKESVPLQRATKLCSDRPALIACMFDGSIRARCTVPRKMVKENFAADKWLQSFATVFDGHIAEAQQGQKPEEVSVMKERKIHGKEFAMLLEKAVHQAETFAARRFCEDEIKDEDSQQSG